MDQLDVLAWAAVISVVLGLLNGLANLVLFPLVIYRLLKR
jgi:membrane-associated protease RseP (regulator of RpoE activity)